MGNVTVSDEKNGSDTNREIKNSVFCDLFSDRKNALSLYNAINGTDYNDENELEIATIDEVIYLHQKNDVSVFFDSKLTLWEHQSTLSYNMPVRGLMYYDSVVLPNQLYIFTRLHFRLLRCFSECDGTPSHSEKRLAEQKCILREKYS